MLCSNCSDSVQIIAFLILRHRYPDLPRPFRSWLGSVGAVLSLIIFLLCLVSVLGFQSVTWEPVALMLGWFFPWTFYW